MTSDLEQAHDNLIGHLKCIHRWASRMSDEQFDFTYNPAAPTGRTLVTHTWQWLICDRMHIEEPDASKHSRVPEPPTDRLALIAELETEAKRWDEMLRAMPAEKLDEVRHQFNDTGFEWSVRGCVYHMLQNVIYKNGQLSYLAFSFGLDGTDPYDAPFPNPIYEEIFGS
jgi:hypothetical protein